MTDPEIHHLTPEQIAQLAAETAQRAEAQKVQAWIGYRTACADCETATAEYERLRVSAEENAKRDQLQAADRVAGQVDEVRKRFGPPQDEPPSNGHEKRKAPERILNPVTE